MKISIIIPLYVDSISNLTESLNSLLNQSINFFEIIIISEPETPKELIKLIKLIKSKKIKLIQNRKRLGISASLNKGIEHAKGEYIARMDSDDICYKNRLSEQFNFMKQNPNIDLIFAHGKYIDKNSKIIGRFTPHSKNYQTDIFKKPLFFHPTLMCKANILKNNKYNSKMKGSEDLELWLRLIKKYNFHILPKKLIKYRLPEQKYSKKKDIWNSRWSILSLLFNIKNHFKNLNYWIMLFKRIIIYFILLLTPNKLYSVIYRYKFSKYYGISN